MDTVSPWGCEPGKRKDYIMRVAVVGAGTVGIQAAWQLSLMPGVEVHAYEASYIGHPEAGAGGESRLFRTLEMDDTGYQPITDRAAQLWRELEAASGRELRHPTGVLVFGDESSAPLRRVAAAAASSSRAEQLDHRQLETRFPQFGFSPAHRGVWDAEGAIIRPELTIRVAAQLAEENGASLHERTPVTGAALTSEGVTFTAGGREEIFDRAVIAVGGWTAQLLPELSTEIVARRLTSAWFGGLTDDYLRGIPPFLSTAPDYCYGIPAEGGGLLKLGLGFNDHLPAPDPDEVERGAGLEEAEKFAWIIRDFLPGLDPRPVRMNTYVESYTPSMHEYVRFHQDDQRLLVMAGFSGHGFKAAPALGEIGAQLITEGVSEISTEFLAEAVPLFTIEDPETGVVSHNPAMSNRNS